MKLCQPLCHRFAHAHTVIILGAERPIGQVLHHEGILTDLKHFRTKTGLAYDEVIQLGGGHRVDDVQVEVVEFDHYRLQICLVWRQGLVEVHTEYVAGEADARKKR